MHSAPEFNTDLDAKTGFFYFNAFIFFTRQPSTDKRDYGSAGFIWTPVVSGCCGLPEPEEKGRI
jgi:hypothetical protein